MSINVNRSLIHKLVTLIITLALFVSSIYILFTQEHGSGLHIVSFFVAIILGMILAGFFGYYAWYALSASDRYTFQEWIKK